MSDMEITIEAGKAKRLLTKDKYCDKNIVVTAAVENIPIYDGETEDVTIISFIIEGEPYQAEDGMTWGEWVNSEYNTGWLGELFTIADSRDTRIVYLVNDDSSVWDGSKLVADTDFIVSAHKYYLV